MSAASVRRLAVVTGASRGIGRAAAEALSQNGFAVALVCEKNLVMAQSIAEELNAGGGEAYAFAADLSCEEMVKSLFAAIESHFGRMPDVLVNNAGIAHANVFADEKTEDYDRVFDVNVRSVFLCCRAVYDAMVAKKWGRIINVSSMWGVCGASCEVLYSASKAAVIGLSKGLALELAPSGVTVNAIAPGVIKTDMLGCYDDETLSELAEQTPVGRLGTPEDIAAVIAFLASDAASFVTGQIIGANGGYIT
ncbi:MAG: 3-oxoacyl-ACP reductase FabG [Clostridia bacterium]|nr:3-oxoacyl-ACP reductase FabG [Clostridia bacterium]